MAAAELCRLCITAARCLIHRCRRDHADSQLPSETDGPSADTPSQQEQQQRGTPEGNIVVDKSVMGDWAAVVFHVGHQTFCASVALRAYKTDSLSLSSGLDFEWWVIFVLINMIDSILQAWLRSASMPIQELEKSFMQFVAPKVALAVVPGMSDRVDIQLDWTFISIVLQRVHSETDEPLRLLASMLIAGAAIVVIIFAYLKIYTDPLLRRELRAEYFYTLEPTEKDAVGVVDLARGCTNLDKWIAFARQSMAKVASPVKQAIAKFEDAPQAVLKLVFIMLVSGISKAGPFLWFTALFSLAKAILLPCLWRGLGKGLPLHTLLRKLSNTEDAGELVQLLRELGERVTGATTTPTFAAAFSKLRLSLVEQTRIYAMASLAAGAGVGNFQWNAARDSELSDVLLKALALVFVPPDESDEQSSRTLTLLDAAAAQAQRHDQKKFPLLWSLLLMPGDPAPVQRFAEAADVLRQAVRAWGSLHHHQLLRLSLRKCLEDEVSVSAADAETLLCNCVRCIFLSILRDREGNVRAAALWALAEIMERAPGAATPELLKEWSATVLPLLSDQIDSVRGAASEVLGNLAASPAATPELLKGWSATLKPLCSDQDWQVRRAASLALGSLASSPAATSEMLKEWSATLYSLLKDRSDQVGDVAMSTVRAAACVALGSFAASPAATQELLKEWSATLKPLLSDQVSGVRWAAFEVVGSLAASPAATQELLKEWRATLHPLLSDEAWSVREAASEALGSLAASAAATQELLKEWSATLLPLLSDHVREREAACVELGSLAASPAATPELLKEWSAMLQPRLSDDNGGVRQVACVELGNLAASPAATQELLKEWSATLKSLLSDPDSGVRWVACNVVGSLASSPTATPE